MVDGKKMNNLNVLYEDNHIIVVLKKENIPVQEDSSKDIDMLTIIKSYLKEKYDKKGNVYLGLVHRLDRPVSGVMVFAKTSKAASRLSNQVRNHSLKKEYHAVVVGNIKNKGNFNIYDAEKIGISDIKRYRDNLPIRIDEDMSNLINISTKENFIPVIDDRNMFIGIITRQDIINYFYKQQVHYEKQANIN